MLILTQNHTAHRIRSSARDDCQHRLHDRFLRHACGLPRADQRPQSAQVPAEVAK